MVLVSRCVWLVVFAAASLTMAAACPAATYVLNVDDVVSMAGQKATITAWLARGSSLAFKNDISRAEVQFSADGKLLGRTFTDRRGTATLVTDLSKTRNRTVRATAVYRGRRITGEGVIYRWSPDRTIVCVDIDDCISRTSYSDLFVTRFDANSQPLEKSVPVLRRLATQYQIMYISARPRFLTQKTRFWLDDNGFPPGPYYHALGFEACLQQGTAKREVLEQLKPRWPNLLIGIGDKGADERCFGAVGMLTLLINTPRFATFDDHCIVLGDWERLGRYFDAQQHRFAEPRRLASFIQRNRDNLRVAISRPEPYSIAESKVATLQGEPIGPVSSPQPTPAGRPQQPSPSTPQVSLAPSAQPQPANRTN